MCGRFQFYDGKNTEIKNIIDMLKKNNEQLELPLGEIFPSFDSAVLLLEDDMLKPHIMKWGYPRKDSKVLIINARSENLNGSFFRDDNMNRRCVIPVSGYYEWDRSKKKHYIHSSSDQMLYLAAIYRKINDQYYYCIVTKEATERLKTIHERMPITMNKKQALEWCLF